MVCLAKIKFPKNNSDILVRRSSAFVNRASSSIVHRSSQRECDTSRFFTSLIFHFFPPFVSCKSVCRNGTFKTNFGPVPIISEKESGVPSETCSSFSISLSSRFLFSISCETNRGFQAANGAFRVVGVVPLFFCSCVLFVPLASACVEIERCAKKKRKRWTNRSITGYALKSTYVRMVEKRFSRDKKFL